MDFIKKLPSPSERHVDSFLTLGELSRFSRASKQHRAVAERIFEALFTQVAPRLSTYDWGFAPDSTDAVKMHVVLRTLKNFGVQVGKLAPTPEAITRDMDASLVAMYPRIPGADVTILVGTLAEQAANVRAWMVAHEEVLAEVPELHLNACALLRIPPELEKYFPNLVALDLADNQLTKIPALTRLQRLRRLTLSNNRLTTIPNFQLPALKSLNLDHNWLSTIPRLEHLLELQRLNLSSNRLRNIHDLSVTCPRLLHLFVERNLLKVIPRGLWDLKDQVGSVLHCLPQTFLWQTELLETAGKLSRRAPTLNISVGEKFDFFSKISNHWGLDIQNHIIEVYNATIQAPYAPISFEISGNELSHLMRELLRSPLVEAAVRVEDSHVSLGAALETLTLLALENDRAAVDPLWIRFAETLNIYRAPEEDPLLFNARIVSMFHVHLTPERTHQRQLLMLFPDVLWVEAGIGRSVQVNPEILHTIFTRVAERLMDPDALGAMMFTQDMLHSSRTASVVSSLPYGIRKKIGSFLQEEGTLVPREKVLMEFEMPCHVEYGQSLEIRGTGLGMSWERGIPLKWSEGDRWHAPLIEREGADYEYKVVLRMPEGSIRWEVGENRHKDSPKIPPVFV